MAADRERPAEEIARSVEALRGHRNRPDRKVSLADEFVRLSSQYERHASGLGRVAEVWSEIAPAEMQKTTRLKGLTRGVLTVTVPDASSRYLLDRALRSGLRRQLVKASPVTLRDVKIRIEPPDGR